MAEENDYVIHNFADGEVLTGKAMDEIDRQVDRNEENIKDLSKYKTEFYVAELTAMNCLFANDNTPYWTIIVEGVRVFGVNVYDYDGYSLIVDTHIVRDESVTPIKVTVYIGMNNTPANTLYACLLCADNAKPEQAEK